MNLLLGNNGLRLVVSVGALLLGGFAFAGDEEPAHLQLARELIGAISPDRNRYNAKPTKVVWPDEATAKVPASNNSVCSSFCAALLRKAYRLDKSDLIRLFTEEWPEADEMFVGVQNRRDFKTIDSVEDLAPGDFIVVDYQSEKAIPTGHVMLASGVPEKVEVHRTRKLPFTFASEAKSREIEADRLIEWHVKVIDSSRSAHGKSDTRYQSVADGQDDDGLGEGPIRLLTDGDGKVVGYTWSTLASSRLWLTKDRPVVFARWKR